MRRRAGGIRRRRTLVGVMGLSLLVSGAQALTLAPVQAEEQATTVTERPDRASASLAASQQGSRVEVSGERSETSSTWVNPDGTLTTQQFAGIVRVRQVDGSFKDVDLTLAAGANGHYMPAVSPYPVSIAAGGGAENVYQPLVTLGTGQDAVSWLWKGVLPTPAVVGDTVTFPSVLPDVDLVVQATGSGFEQSFIVNQRPEGPLALPLPVKTGTGVNLADGSPGEVRFVSAAGKVLGESNQPLMWDAKTEPGSDQPLAVLPVAADLVPAGSTTTSIDLVPTTEPTPANDPAGTEVPTGEGLPTTNAELVSALSAVPATTDTLVLAPDPVFMAAADTKYPVTVDPIVSWGPTFDTYVQSGLTSDQSGSTSLQIGKTSTQPVARTFFNFNVSSMAGKTITNATLGLFETYSTTCVNQQWDVWHTSLASSSTRWTAQPTWYSQWSSSMETLGYNSSCAGGRVHANVTSLVQSWANSNFTAGGIGLRGHDEASTFSRKTFVSADSATLKPYLQVTYSTPPSTPTNQAIAPSAVVGSTRYATDVRPTLTARAVDPDAGNISLAYEVYAGSAASPTSLVASGTSSGLPSTDISWQLPVGALTEGGQFEWRVKSSDAAASSAWSGWQVFTVDSGLAAPTNVRASAIPGGAIVRWTSPPSASRTSFRVEALSATNQVQKTISVKPELSSVVVPGLPAGTSTFRVTPTTAVGDGSGSLSPPTALTAPLTNQLEGAPFALDLAVAVSNVTFGDRLPSGWSWSLKQPAMPVNTCPPLPVNPIFIGATCMSNLQTAGSLRITNLTGSTLTLDDAEVWAFNNLNPATPTKVYPGDHRWQAAGLQIPAGKSMILTQTNESYWGNWLEEDMTVNSVHSEGCTASPSAPPVVKLTVNGKTYSLVDSGRVLDTGGQRVQSCTPIPLNPFTPWTPIGSIPPPYQKIGEGSPSSVAADCSGAPHTDPVNCQNGDFWHTFDDLGIPGRGSALNMKRTYDSARAGFDGPLGFGWSAPYSMFLTQRPDYQDGAVELFEEGGTSLVFTPAASWRAGVQFSAPPGTQADLTWNATTRQWTFVRHGRDTFVFDDQGRLVVERDLNGNETTLAYSPASNLQTVTDDAGRTLTFGYNAGGKISSVSDSTGRSVTYGYTGSELTSSTDVMGKISTYEYEATGSHRLTKWNDPRPVATRGSIINHYDAQGRVDSQTDQRGKVTTLAYATDSAGAAVTTVTAPTGAITKQTYTNGLLTKVVKGFGTADETTRSFLRDPGTHQVSEIRDGLYTGVAPNDKVESKTYDGNGNLLTRTDKDGHQWSWTYNARNQPLTQVRPASLASGSGTVTTTNTYDASGNLTGVSTPTGNGSEVIAWSYEYTDSANPGLRTKATDPNGHATLFAYDAQGNLASSDDAAGKKTTWGYDTAGRIVWTTSPRGNEPGATATDYRTAFLVNNFGDVTKITDPYGKFTLIGYDENRNRVLSTDALGKVTSWTPNKANLVETQTLPDGSTTIQTRYDDNQNVDYVLNERGMKTDYTFDNLDRVKQVADPLLRTTTIAYDLAGRRSSLSRSAGATQTYGYDWADRLTSVNYSDATPDVTYAYYDGGERRSMTDGTGTTTWALDRLGRPDSSTDGSGDLVDYSLDLAGNVTGIAYPGGVAVSRGFDAVNRLASVTDWNARQTQFGYDPDGHLVSTTSPNGVVSTATFDRRGSMSAMSHVKAGSTLASFTYGRDDVGRVMSETSTGMGQPVQSFGYNNVDQLTTTPGGAVTYSPTDHLATAPGSVTQAFDNADQIVSRTVGSTVTTYSQDGRGNRTGSTGGATAVFGFDGVDRLTSSTVAGVPASNVFDGDGLRVAKTTGGVTSQQVWDTATSGLPVLLADGATRFVYGPGGRPIEQVSGSATVFLHADQLGSTRVLTDTAGAVTGTYSYSLFGEVTTHGGTASTVMLFNGQQRDTESGLYYLRARFMDPTTGLFLTRDPFEAVTGLAYAYTPGDPLNYADPSGLRWSVGQIAGAVALAAGLVALTIATGGADLVVAALVVGGVSAETALAAGSATVAVGAVAETTALIAGGVASGYACAPAQQQSDGIRPCLASSAGLLSGGMAYGYGFRGLTQESNWWAGSGLLADMRGGGSFASLCNNWPPLISGLQLS